jgi:PTS system nitrogen regulatory IIA component
VDLKIKDIADLLQVSEKTVYRWVSEKKLPSYRINHQYRFNKDEIKEWILKNKAPVSDGSMNSTINNKNVSLIDCLNNGGIYYKIAGSTVEEALRNSIDLIKTPVDIEKETILSLLLKREEMMSTAIGSGIAAPHPRTPIISDISNESVSICFLNSPVDFKALDGIPVFAVIIVLSANPARHLEILSKISYLCRQEQFVELLKREPLREDILEYIRAEKKKWDKIRQG